MQIEFMNGSTVSQMWGDLTDGEVVAAFQYERDALMFAQAKAADDAKHKMNRYHIVTDHRTGKLVVIRQAAAEQAAAEQAAARLAAE